MAGEIAANRYAKSLIALAKEQNNLDAVYSDMQQLASTIEESKELSLLLKSPIVKPSKKQEILRAIFSSKVSELTIKFLELISSRKREGIVEGIAKSFVSQYKELNNITVAQVTSAVKLDSEQRDKILQLINKDHKGQVEIEESINPDLIGGFVVRVGDKQVDASIRRELEDLKQEFTKNPYIAEF